MSGDHDKGRGLPATKADSLPVARDRMDVQATPLEMVSCPRKKAFIPVALCITCEAHHGIKPGRKSPFTGREIRYIQCLTQVQKLVCSFMSEHDAWGLVNCPRYNAFIRLLQCQQCEVYGGDVTVYSEDVLKSMCILCGIISERETTYMLDDIGGRSDAP